jgi:hypothetical protein
MTAGPSGADGGWIKVGQGWLPTATGLRIEGEDAGSGQ